MPELPPWLMPAQAAQFAARGMALGVQAAGQRSEDAYRAAALQQRSQEAAAEMAAQQQAREFEQNFRMQQAARAQQQDAMEQSRFEQEHQLAASAAAKKFEAIQNYENAVRGGMDPNSAILLYGPAMGQSTAEAAAIRAASAQRQKPAPTWQVQTSPTGEKAWVSSAGNLHPITAPRQPAGTKPAMTEVSRWNLINHTDAAIAKLYESAGSIDLSLEKAPDSWNEATKAKFNRYKAELKRLEQRRDILQAGFDQGAGGQMMMPPGMEGADMAPGGPQGTNAPLRIVAIRPKEQINEAVKGGLMTAQSIRAPEGGGGGY